MNKLSLVISVFNEEENVVPLARKIHDALSKFDYEVVFVDDGSTDSTVQQIKSLKDSHIHLIELVKNYGQSSALSAGIDYASGNFIWAKQLGGGGTDLSFSLKTDPFENIYTSGTFSDIVDFDPGLETFNLISAGLADIFVHKMNYESVFIKEFITNPQIGVYPNPVKDIATFSSTEITSQTAAQQIAQEHQQLLSQQLAEEKSRLTQLDTFRGSEFYWVLIACLYVITLGAIIFAAGAFYIKMKK